MKEFISLKLRALLQENLYQKPILNGKTLYESMLASIDEEISTIPADVLNSFKLQDSLNKDIWDSESKLNPKVKFKLLEIAKDFFNELELPKNIKLQDVIFTGSLANFNWSKFSDIDLHLVIDYSKFKEDEEFITKHFKTEKTLWNDIHDIKIYNYPIEIYVQDVNDELAATAIFSVMDNKWLKKPKREEFTIDKSEIKDKAKKFFNQFNDIVKSYDKEDYKTVVSRIDTLWDKIKKMRQDGLATEAGEFSENNILFKVLRRMPLMDELDQLRKTAYDKSMTLAESKILNESNVWHDGGILLIKGAKLPDGTQRLYATHIKKILELPRNRKDDTSGVAARMAILSDIFYVIKQIPDPQNQGATLLKGFKMDYRNDVYLSKVLKMKNQSASVVLNNKKTPLHWESLRFNNLPAMFSRIGNDIKQLPDIKWD